jgi:hypothetical protein
MAEQALTHLSRHGSRQIVQLVRYEYAEHPQLLSLSQLCKQFFVFIKDPAQVVHHLRLILCLLLGLFQILKQIGQYLLESFEQFLNFNYQVILPHGRNFL